MANPFKQKPPVDKPKRNTFDLSFANNLSLNFGRLYPVLCKEVVPGDSFTIDTSFGLRFMPMAFPVQTRIRADIHYFYVRSRNLWKDFPDFIGATKENLTPPYLQTNDPKAFTTGSLADYLGVPTTIGGNFNSNWMSLSSSNLVGDKRIKLPSEIEKKQISHSLDFNSDTYLQKGLLSSKQDLTLSMWRPIQSNNLYSFEDLSIKPIPHYQEPEMYPDCIYMHTVSNLNTRVKITSQINLLGNNGNGTPQQILLFSDRNLWQAGETSNEKSKDILIGAGDINFTQNHNVYSSPRLNQITCYKYSSNGAQLTNLYSLINDYIDIGATLKIVFMKYGNFIEYGIPGTGTYQNFATNVQITNTDITQIVDVANYATPYLGANPLIKINAMPFRAYEAVWNGFFRNQQVDPFKPAGIPEYNKYITNNNGGADTTTPLTFNNRYWEDDVFTTCLPSPQQGLAPLVGARQADPGQSYYTIDTIINSEPSRIEVQTDSEDKMTLVTKYGKDTPESTIKALNEAIAFGISINDFRNVNSLQRWLEKNVRRGFRYRDQILTHFGVSVRYDELDMPEFLGGVSENVTMQAISQTVQNDQAPLGAYAGQGSVFGNAKHKINHYFDEHGYVLAVMSVVPIPTYSQNMPKMFNKFNHLDYFFPEFNHISLQPVPLREVAPLQAINANVSLDKTFGYQRAWYDYLASTDEVHGDMRLSLRDFLLNRVYGDVPELGQKFLSIYPEETNDIFTVRDTHEDKIVGQIYFDIKAKRPISRFAEGRID